MTRDQLYEALFEKLRYCADFAYASRRLRHWSEVLEQPALFVIEGPYQHYPDGDYLRPRQLKFDAEVWLYTKNDANVNAADAPPPAQELDRLIDTVERTIAGDQPFRITQTLGIDGVIYCRPEGRVEINPGHLDGQAIAIVPVVICVAENYLVGGI